MKSVIEEIQNLNPGESMIYYTGIGNPPKELKDIVGLLARNGTHIPNLRALSRDRKAGSTFEYIVKRKNKPFIGKKSW